AVGAVAGGLAGKSMGERVNPTVEEAYWRENYRQESYHKPEFGYDDYAPAYRTGYEGRARYADRDFDQVEPDLRNEYQQGRGNSRLEWEDAREARGGAWHRGARAPPGGADGGGRGSPRGPARGRGPVRGAPCFPVASSCALFLRCALRRHRRSDPRGLGGQREQAR